MLVDDEKAFTDLMGALLDHALGMKTFVFNDPYAALAVIDTLQPTVVISDYRMPGLDGFDFLHEVARRRPDVPSIMVTGNALDAETIARRRPATMLGVLFKPLSWRDIAAMLRQHSLIP